MEKSEIKQLALDVMLKEMLEDHTSTEDAIHNWICEQNDSELFEGIVKPGKSINSAMKYCSMKAQEFRDGNAAMIEDNTVFKWVREFLINDVKIDRSIRVETKKVETGIVANSDASKERVKPKKKQFEKEKQISLFDL